FVSAHWDDLSPVQRMAVVLVMVGGFHLAGAACRFSWLGVALHTVGTIALGAGIALTGQIFNLDEHWPTGILLCAAGAGPCVGPPAALDARGAYRDSLSVLARRGSMGSVGTAPCIAGRGDQRRNLHAQPHLPERALRHRRQHAAQGTRVDWSDRTLTSHA